VPGGGVALLRVRKALDRLKGATLEQQSGIAIVRAALAEPLRRIASNAAVEPSVVVQRVAAGNGDFGYDAASGRYGRLLRLGVIDPAKVTRLALQNAVSIAGLVMTTDCMIASAAPRSGPGGPPDPGSVSDLS
jgi:chaperonin GroEL